MLADLYDRYLERKKIQIVLTIIVVFLVSMVMSCQELHYMISGKTVDAAMTTRVEKEERHGEIYAKRVVGFRWVDGDKTREEFETVPLDWPGVDSATVKVQYIAGKDNQSRLYGEHNYGWVTLFFASLATGAVGLYWLSKEG